MKENSLKVLAYLQEADAEGRDVTAVDIADALELGQRTVNGILTAAFQKHVKIVDGEKVNVPLITRIAVEGKQEDGKPFPKIIKLTEEGRTFDPTAEENK